MKKNLIINWIVLILFSLIMILPIVVLLIWSVGQRYSWPHILPEHITIIWWKNVFSDARFYSSLLNTIIIGAMTSIIGLAMSIPIGKYLSKYNSLKSRLLEGIMFLPILISPVVITLGLYKSLSIMGLTGNIFGIIIVHLIPCLPYGIRIIKASYENFDYRYLEQSKFLNTKPYQIRLFVQIPMMWPSFLAGFHLMFLISMSQYVLTLFVGNGRVQTLSTQMYPYLSGGNMSIGAIYSLVFALVAVSFMLILEKILSKRYKRN